MNSWKNFLLIQKCRCNKLTFSGLLKGESSQGVLNAQNPK